MSEQKVMNRWLVVVGAILIQLSLGAIYAWSVFTPYLTPQAPKKDKETKLFVERVVFIEDEGAYIPKAFPINPTPNEETEKLITIKAFKSKEGDAPKTLLVTKDELEPCEIQVAVKKEADTYKLSAVEKSAGRACWTSTQTQIVFAVGLAVFALVMVIAGRMMPKIGPRKLAISGGIVLGLGYMLSGFLGGLNFINTLIGVGIIGGAGIGLGYVVPIAVGMRWFPDKKGLITGLAVAGFGFGALLWIKLAGAWGSLLPAYGINTTFIIYGAIFLVTVVLGGLWMVFPPEGYKPAGWNPPVASGAGKPVVAGTVDFTTSEMLGTPQYYMLFLCFVFSAGAGLTVIGTISLFGIDSLRGTVGAVQAAAIAGTAMGVFYALANGIGRIAWGSISDKIGRKLSLIIMAATQGIFLLAFIYMVKNEYAFYLAATLIGFNFGGNFALFPTVTADTFGTKNVGQNYGWVFLAYGVGGIVGPIMTGLLRDHNMFEVGYIVCGILCIVAAVIACMISHPKKATA